MLQLLLQLLLLTANINHLCLLPVWFPVYVIVTIFKHYACTVLYKLFVEVSLATRAPQTLQRPLPNLLKIAIKGSLVALHGFTMHVASSPGTISSFAVLHTEKLAF